MKHSQWLLKPVTGNVIGFEALVIIRDKGSYGIGFSKVSKDSFGIWRVQVKGIVIGCYLYPIPGPGVKQQSGLSEVCGRQYNQHVHHSASVLHLQPGRRAGDEIKTTH